MLTQWMERLDHAIERRFDQMVEIRRQLHRHPEVSGQERQTSMYLYQLLGDAGFNVQMGPDGRGIITDMVGGTPMPDRGLLALRADIDALRIHDEKDVSYRSQCDGVMHACGHDAHTAILVGTLAVLQELQERGELPYPICVRGIFQPSEETATGAREMIAVGAMDGVSGILNLHVDPTRPLGIIGLRTGVITAHCDEIEFRIVGRGGHGARPHEARDPIAAAAQLINALYLFIPRVADSRDAVVSTIGQVQAGHTANVIPEEVIMRGTVRTLEEDVRASTHSYIQRLAEGVGQTADVEIHVQQCNSTPSVVNDPAMVALLQQSISTLGDAAKVQEISRPSMGSEDYSFYLACAPGAMFRLGCTSDQISGASLHNPVFDIDERALKIGTQIMARSVVHWAAPEQAKTDRTTS